MYAARRHYVQRWAHQKPEERYQVIVARGYRLVPYIRSERIKWVEEELMYWRKATHIHKWFVDHVQRGNDDNGTYHVEEKELRELRETCERVIESCELIDGTIVSYWTPAEDRASWVAVREPGKVIKDSTIAEQLLPTWRDYSGDWEYNERYLGDVVQTRDWLTTLFADPPDVIAEGIYYSSS